ncbi:MAG: aminoglycoside phosphotransferase [Sulfurovum sp.]|nr:MAG: aminoglycoside phosphotransferase [Sulfurovum sp.]
MHSIKAWLRDIGWDDWHIEEASADASFRSYYRLTKEHQSYILMDSSRMLESLPPFLDMHERLQSVNVRVPSLVEKNTTLGYLIIEDFGSKHYLDVLNASNYRVLYQKAIDEIIKMQQADIKDLPLYDRDFLSFEMQLMQEWYLEKFLGQSLKEEEKNLLNTTFQYITNVVLEQPQGVFVHRDYHSRNLMLTKHDEIGIIDFQDARVGAITYDLVSLLKDCYIQWDTKEIEKLALYYRDKAVIDVDDATFIKWFDFMGLQRHIKILGIFARLYLRDGKDGYLKDIPLTLNYIVKTASKYPQTKAFVALLQSKIHKE